MLVHAYEYTQPYCLKVKKPHVTNGNIFSLHFFSGQTC